MPAEDRPRDERPIHTADLKDTPTREYSVPAVAWVEAPPELLALDDAVYLRRIGPWLLWRSGAARGPATYLAIHADDLTRQHALVLDAEGVTSGTGPEGTTHTRFRTWKESLRDHP